MAKGLSGRVRAGALFFAFAASSLVSIAASAQVPVGYAESPGDSLARNVKVLGSNPKNFDALVGAGRAALQMGDTQAAAGFFGRAEEVWPGSPLPQAGMGAAMALDGDGAGALQYFARAMQRGATRSMIGADRGLAHDLLGQHAEAQVDYRSALMGRDGDEARRRLALSLAITGNKAEALSMLGPLMARGDAASARTRAFVLALTGDVAGARSAMEAAMPGSSAQMDYFFRRLPTLRSDQKAAAVNLGIFPGSGTQLASAASTTRGDGSPADRIQSIEQWLSAGRAAAPAVSQPAPPPQQVASVTIPTSIARNLSVRSDSAAAVYGSRKLWLQLASGVNAASLPGEFRRLKSRNRDLFEGISGYVAEERGKARLLIGPFRNADEADIFAQDLETVHIDAFTWTSQPGQTIRKLSTE